MEEEELTVQLGGTYSCKRKNGTYRDGEVVKLRVNKRSGIEEYFVHYVGLTRRQAEWVDKTRLVLCKPVKKDEEEDDVEIGAEQKISEDEKTTQNPRPEEDEPEAEAEPETKKVKVDTSGALCKDNEHTCLLCREFCEDSVEVECGHRFCRNCINNALASQDSFLCPDCEKVITGKKLDTKLPLAAISKTVVDATSTLVQPLEMVKAQPLEICAEHDEKLKLFCKDDGVLSCIICRDALKHFGHKFMPVVDAVEVYRTELPTLVSPLEEALKEASARSNQQSEIIERLQNTIMECRQHIVSEFGNLYNFLKEPREKLLEQLKEQSQCLLEEMKPNTAKMEEKRDCLKETISVIEQKLDEADPVSFLDGIKDFVKKCREQQEAVTSSGNMMTKKQLCRATFNAPIQYFTWKQMKSVVPVPENEQLLPAANTDQVPESSTNILMLKDSATESIQQPNPPEEIHMECEPANAPVPPLSVRKEDAAESLVNLPVWWHFAPENEQLLVAPNTDQVPESSSNLLMLKDSATESFQQPNPPEEIHMECEPANAPVPSLSVRKEDAAESLVNLPMWWHFTTESIQQPNPPEEIHMECEPANAPVQPLSVRKEDAAESLAALPVQKHSGPKEIWMVGDYFMDAVYRRVEHGPPGLNLGLDRQTCNLHWLHHSVNGGVLFNSLREAKRNLQAPDIIFFNSSPDLKDETNASFNDFKSDLLRISYIVPNAVLIVSACLPMPSNEDPTLDLYRTKFNNLLAAHVKRPAFLLFRHMELEEMILARISYKDNGPLTDVEVDLFLTAVRDVLQKTLCKDLKPVTEKCWTLSSAGPPASAVTTSANFQVKKKEESSTQLIRSDSSSVCQLRGSKQIWIVGDGFMNSIKSQAEASHLGLNLGFPKEICNIRWMECETWIDLCPKLNKSAASLGTPDTLLFHLGSKDLFTLQLQTVINCAGIFFKDFLRLFPNVKIILSTLLPKPDWRKSRAELKRKGFNYSLIFRVNKPPYHLLNHEELEKKLTLRYATGDLNLVTEAEAKDFLQGMKDVLQQTVLKDYKPSVAECELLPPGEVPSDKVQNEVTVKGPDQPSTSKEVDSAATITGKDQPAIVRVEAPVASANPPGLKEIWITGSSYILKASLHAKKSKFGKNLGLDEQQWVVRWINTIQQYSLMNDLSKANRKLGTPSIVYLHIGSNDLGLVEFHTLIDDFTSDISQLAKLYPETQFIFSTILPRPEWLHNALEISRQRFNTAICAYAKTRGFTVQSNIKLEEELLDRYYVGRGFPSLSFVENAMFLTSIKLSIQEAMLKGSRPVTETTEPQKEVLSTGSTLIIVPGADPDAPTENNDDDKAIEEKETLYAVPSAFVEEGGKSAEEEKEEEQTKEEKEETECLQPATEVEAPEGWLDPPVDAPFPSDLESKQIWIVGNSYIYTAAQQASGSSYGFHLGFKPGYWTIHWMGRVGMQWKSLSSELNDALSTLGVPDIVFVHLGDNDVGNIPYDTLSNTIENCLSQITMQFPMTEFIFSTMLPKAEWLTNSLEQVRQDLNFALVRYAEELGFHVALYEGIEESAIRRFKNGGSNVLSYAEYDLFVKSIKDALEMIVRKLEKAQTV